MNRPQGLDARNDASARYGQDAPENECRFCAAAEPRRANSQSVEMSRSPSQPANRMLRSDRIIISSTMVQPNEITATMTKTGRAT